tara:strand:- start:157 stop:1590 length:1434 start_codon:yes stop_codon:yes gene_type:complete
MSYRNPQQFGIVEDMTAGTRAFQKGFGQVEGIIEKNKKEREEEDVRRDTNNASWVTSTNAEISKHKYLSAGYESLMRDMISKDVGSEFFDKKSKTNQALLMGKLQDSSKFGNEFFQLVGKVKSGEIELDNPAMMEVINSIEKNPKYALDKDNDPTLNGIKFSVLNKEMSENYAVTGNQKQFDDKLSNVRARIEKDIKQFETGKDREITEDEKLEIIGKHVTNENMVRDPSSHYVYKNIMTKDDKKDSKFNDVDIQSQLTGDSLQVGYSDYTYNGAGLKDETRIKDFESYRDNKIKNFYVNKINQTLIDPAKPVNYSKLNYQRQIIKSNQEKIAKEKELVDFNKVKQNVINSVSPFRVGGEKPKSDAELSKDYAGVSIDDLPGMPSGAGMKIRSVNVVNPKGAPTDSYLVQFNFGKMSGQTDLPASKVFDLSDPKILNQLRSNMSRLDKYGSYKDDLTDSFTPKANLTVADLINKYSN